MTWIDAAYNSQRLVKNENNCAVKFNSQTKIKLCNVCPKSNDGNGGKGLSYLKKIA